MPPKPLHMSLDFLSTHDTAMSFQIYIFFVDRTDEAVFLSTFSSEV